MIVLRPPGYYSYLDPGLVHTEFGFASAAYQVADDASIQAGLVFKEDALGSLAVRALEIFLAAGVEYSGTNVALSVYQAISERMPQDSFTWSVEGLEDIIRTWPTPSPIERAKASPEQREPAPEKPLRMPEEVDSPELVTFPPKRVPPLPVPPEEAVLPPEGPPPPSLEVEPTVVIPEIARPPTVPEVRRPVRPPEALPVPSEIVPPEEIPAEIVPPEEIPAEKPPVDVRGEPITDLGDLNYSEIQRIADRAVDRLGERLKDPGVTGQVETIDEIEVPEEWVKAQWKRDFRLAKEAAGEVMEGQEVDERDWIYPVSLPGQ